MRANRANKFGTNKKGFIMLNRMLLVSMLIMASAVAVSVLASRKFDFDKEHGVLVG